MANRAYRRAASRADRYTNKKSYNSASRKFHPSQFMSVNQNTPDHDTWLFFYNGIEMVWTAEYLPFIGAWQLVLSYANYSGHSVSDDEIKAFLQESGIVSDLPYEDHIENSSLDGTPLHYYVQMLPEKPVLDFSCPLSLLPVEDQGVLPLTPELYKEISSLSPGRIKEAVHNPAFEDEAAVIFAHKIIAKSPYSTGTQKIESIKWLHNLGCKVNMGLS